MKNTKQKSSGWRPADKRATWQERQERRDAAETAYWRKHCDRAGLWRFCPVRRCRRVRGCIGKPWQCMQRQKQGNPQQGSGDAHRSTAAPAPCRQPAAAAQFFGCQRLPVVSAAEAAAAIAASVAEALQAQPLPEDELDAIIRDSAVHDVARR